MKIALIGDNPQTPTPVISALACKLYDESDTIEIEPDSRVGRIYQPERIEEEYHCGFGVNPEYSNIFDDSELGFCGRDDAGQTRILELPGHRVPARAFGFQKMVHPLISAYLAAVV